MEKEHARLKELECRLEDLSSKYRAVSQDWATLDCERRRLKFEMEMTIVEKDLLEQGQLQFQDIINLSA